MKKLYKIFFLLFLFFLIYPLQSSLSQDSEYDESYSNYNPDFSFQLQNFYSFNETVNIKVRMSYTEKDEYMDLNVYKVIDIDKFITNQKSYQNVDIISSDSSNLLQYCELKENYNLKFNSKAKLNSKKEFEYYYLDTNIEYVPQDKGFYVIKLRHKIRISYAGFVVTNLAMITESGSNGVLCYVANKFSGEPVNDVNIRMYFGKALSAQGKTGNGVFIKSVNDSEKNYTTKNNTSTALIVGEIGGDVIISDPNTFFNFSENRYTAYIHTEQPVYRPNTMVHFKATFRKNTENNYENFDGQKLSIIIKDTKNAILYRKLLKTDINGSISDSIFIDENGAVGGYTITASIDEKNSFNGSFIIEEYKKPEFKVELTLDKPQYTNKEVITGKVKSDYYFGSPVQEADVEYKIFKQPFARPWWFFSDYRWWYEQYYNPGGNNYSNSKFIYNGKGKLSKDGKFEFAYSVEESFIEKTTTYWGEEQSYETDYTYIIQAEVTDKSRRTISATSTVFVTRALFSTTSKTDKYVYKPGDKIGLEVHAIDFSNKPVSAGFSVSVNRITWEKKKNKWDYKKKITFVATLSGKTLYNGDGIVFLDASDYGYYVFDVTSFDERGKKITSQANCYVSSGDMSWWYNINSGAMQILTDKDSYKPGDVCRALIINPIQDANLLISVKNNNIVYFSTQKLIGESDFIDIPISENYYPNVNIQVSYIYNTQLYTNQVAIPVLPEKKFLNVELSADKTKYKPRENGLVTVKVTDLSGNPVPNADVSLGMIDESIYSIHPDNTADIRNNFYSPKKYNSYLNINHIFNSYNRSYYPGIFEKFDFKKLTKSDLSTVRGRLNDIYHKVLPNVLIMIDEQYVAAVTQHDGTFEFQIPDGEYTLSVLFNERMHKGYFNANILKSNSYYYDIVIDEESIFSVKDYDWRRVEVKDNVTEKSEKEKGTLRGVVLEGKTNNPIVGAIVKLEGTAIGSETDNSGAYIINNIPEGTYNIRCSSIGYETGEVSNFKVYRNLTTSLNFKLSPRGLMTDTLEIIAKRNSISMDQSGRIVTEEIENVGIRGIKNIVSKTSGVVQDERNGMINIRGGRTSETAIIIDGVLQDEFIEAETRSDFRDAMLWLPSVTTDENGIANVNVKFPDNLTTWRITARVITNDTKVGQNTYNVISRKDLIIRLEPPRFFQDKDEVTVSGIIHNYLNEDKQTKITLKTENLFLDPKSLPEQVIKIGKNEEKRIDWKIKVTEPMGMAKLNASALTNEESDAVEFKIPLQPHGLKINKPLAFDFSKLNKNKSEFVEIPEGTDLKTVKLRIGVSPSVASSVTASLYSLVGYPYGCIEQTMSRFMPTVIVQNILKEMNAPQDEYLLDLISKIKKKSLDKIYAWQKKDGGWGWWSNDKSDPFMSAYVVYGLLMARNVLSIDTNNVQNADAKDSVITGEAGSFINNEVIAKGLKYVRSTLSLYKIEPATRVFSMFVLSQSDSLDAASFFEQLKRFDSEDINDFSTALLSLTAAKLGYTEIQKKYIENLISDRKYDGENGIYWAGKMWHYNWSDDVLQTTAFALKALLNNPEIYRENKDIVNKTVEWIMFQRKGNSWGSTQQNAFLTYALADYLKISKEDDPDYNIKISVNNQQVLDKQMTKDDVFKKETSVDVDTKLLKIGQNELKAEKNGVGKIYFSSNLSYYTNEKKLEPVKSGFEIHKEYFILEKKIDYKKGVINYVKTPFKETVKSGTPILVKVRVNAKDKNAKYFMLDDPIPSGCEVIKDDWVYPINEENDYKGYDYYNWRWWYADKDVRDNRVSFFASYMGGDTYEFSYIMRALIPGTYNVIPATGMLMYYPEVRGSSEELKIQIED